jgi:hypothetical protein
MLTIVRFTALLAACSPQLRRQTRRTAMLERASQWRKQMNATLRRGTRETLNRDESNKTGITIFGAGLGEGFGAAFAIAVMLGALWLLLSGYV